MKKSKSSKEAKRAYNDECTIPSPVPHSFADQAVFNRPVHQADEIREYVYYRTAGENVTHLEKLAPEHIFDRQIDGWDVRTDQGRY